MEAPSNEVRPINAPEKIGVYPILECLEDHSHSGVYRCFDPHDERPILIKVWKRPDHWNETKLATSLPSTLRTLKKLTLLRSPSVVKVHEVGTHQSDIFVAMDAVEGVELSQWLESRPSWKDILASYLQVGEGLAQAHAKGIVHQGFSPKAIIRGEDGQSRVIDFFAWNPHAPSVPLEKSSEAIKDPFRRGMNHSHDANLSQLEQADQQHYYLSPEQHLGQEATPLSDQFSFCASLYHSLYGQLPYGSKSLPGLALETNQGAVLIPEQENDVPRPVRQIIARGLHPEAHKRHASMEDLLRALHRDHAPSLWQRESFIHMTLLALIILGFSAILWKL